MKKLSIEIGEDYDYQGSKVFASLASAIGLSVDLVCKFKMKTGKFREKPSYFALHHTHLTIYIPMFIIIYLSVSHTRSFSLNFFLNVIYNNTHKRQFY